ncbi:MAG: hypothetical protein Q7R60_02620 [bacterium]|nr:hypothetical protein [bacterium]
MEGKKFSIPRLGWEGKLPEGLPEPVITHGERVITVNPPEVGDRVSIPRLDISGEVVEIKEVAVEGPNTEKTE